MANIKHTKQEKAILAKRNEKVINDFLLQFAYTLLIGVITIFAFTISPTLYFHLIFL